MLKCLAVFTAFLLPIQVSLHAADVSEHLSPHQRAILDSKSPPAEEYRFGFDLPAGPQFSEAEKEAQRGRGGEVMPMVMKAFESGAAEVRIPPGDYRFGQERWEGAKVIFPLGFEDMQRRRPDTGRIQALLGWQPQLSLEDIIGDVATDMASRLNT